MNPTNIKDLLFALRAELLRFKLAVVFVFIVVSSLVLTVGYLIPKQYTSNSLLSADVTNIIEGLLEGKAEVTKVTNHAKTAEELMKTRSILERAARNAELIPSGSGEQKIAEVTNSLRSSIRLSARSGSYFSVQYTSGNPDRSFLVLSEVINAFLEESVKEKRAESENAFTFIDAQVSQYKRQLELAENQLKEFQAQNVDISENSVSSRISALKRDIETVELSIAETQERRAQIKTQLTSEQEFKIVEVGKVSAQAPQTLSATALRLNNLQNRLDELRLVYFDTHPDIIALQEQIVSLEIKLEEERAATPVQKQEIITETIENPVYNELRLNLAEEESSLRGLQRRLSSLQKLLDDEYSNAARVAENQATLKELTRDYDVTKQVYEEMLQRKESARLSMTLDIEGQGVSYKIQEPPSYPVRWDGPQLIQFALVGPVLGLLIPFGLIIALILFDGKVRSAEYMEEALDNKYELLTAIPHYDSTMKSQLTRTDTLGAAALLIAFGIAYMAFVATAVIGIDINSLRDLLP